MQRAALFRTPAADCPRASYEGAKWQRKIAIAPDTWMLKSLELQLIGVLKWNFDKP
jgi:hypothetical protein